MHDKGLDFLARFNSTYILGEAKFLSDFGGHQTAQFNDAIATLEVKLKKTAHTVIKIAILDGVRRYTRSQQEATRPSKKRQKARSHVRPAATRFSLQPVRSHATPV